MIYDKSFKTLINPKLLQTRFINIDRIIVIYDDNRYLTLFDSEKYDAIFNKIRYLTRQNSDITYNFPLYFAEVKFLSYDSLPIEKD